MAEVWTAVVGAGSESGLADVIRRVARAGFVFVAWSVYVTCQPRLPGTWTSMASIRPMASKSLAMRSGLVSEMSR